MPSSSHLEAAEVEAVEEAVAAEEDVAEAVAHHLAFLSAADAEEAAAVAAAEDVEGVAEAQL